MPSFPQRKKIRLAVDAYQKPGVWYFVTVCCRKKESRFEKSDIRDLVANALLETVTVQKVEIAAYTIMPNHLHFICSSGRTGLVAFVREFKSRTEMEIRKQTGNHSPWQARFFDHKLRSDESLQQIQREAGEESLTRFFAATCSPRQGPRGSVLGKDR